MLRLANILATCITQILYVEEDLDRIIEVLSITEGCVLPDYFKAVARGTDPYP